MKKLLYFLLALIAICLIGYAIVINLPKASSKNKDAEYTLTSIDLFSEFSNQEQAANKKYIGKTVEVSGKVMEIDQDKQESTVFYLSANAGYKGVLCTMENNKKNSKVKIGDVVKIKGQCAGLLQDVVINKCVLISE